MDMQYCAPANFAQVFNFPHGQASPMQYPEGQYSVPAGFHGVPYMYAFQQPRDQLMTDRNCLGDGKTESKPRLSKEDVEKLEKVFQENPKPSSSVKAQLADVLALERPRINNWFQNRRAKAKQERKQEEYEARRAAEKDHSEPASPLEYPSNGSAEPFGDNVQRVQPSSALFPDVSSNAHASDDKTCDSQYEDDMKGTSEEPDSPCLQQQSSHQNDPSDAFQSPLSLDFSPAGMTGFPQRQAKQHYNHQESLDGFTPLVTPNQSLESGSQSGRRFDGLPSPEEHGIESGQQGRQYQNILRAGYPTNSTTAFFPGQSLANASEMNKSLVGENEARNGLAQQPQNLPTPTDSFKSPPPPANIASRRNIPRPATLQAASLRSRSYNLACGSKTAMDGTRRMDPSSPAATMRRIVSNNGTMAGRIQKSATGPRSPMFFGRASEAFLQYHARSPAGPATAPFPAAAPPTPMTPVALNQSGLQEPTVSSTCSDDDSFIFDSASSCKLMHDLKAETDLKTPPGTPNLITNLARQNLTGNLFNAAIDFSAENPVLTPFCPTEFIDLAMRNVPSYVDFSDGSLPSTPLCQNMMAPYPDGPFVGNGTGNPGNTQYDWDANESVISSKSSPGQSRTNNFQFTQNMTPQDYTAHQDK